MKIKHSINLHKALTSVFVLSLMLLYNNFTIGAWIYLALHGTYGILWLFKDRIYPDRQWEQEISFPKAIVTFLLLGLYWVAPYLLISRNIEIPLPIIAIAIFLNLLGVFLHYSSDAQKYYTLKYHQRLIDEGFFARSRNPNYLGEILIYFSFALLTLHWLPFLILAGFVSSVFLPNMLKKDCSLARYSQFNSYQNNSGLLLPKIFLDHKQQSISQSE